MLTDRRIAELVENACEQTIKNGDQFNYWSVESAIRVAIRETQEACAAIVEERGRNAKNGEWKGNNHAAGSFAEAIRKAGS